MRLEQTEVNAVKELCTSATKTTQYLQMTLNNNFIYKTVRNSPSAHFTKLACNQHTKGTINNLEKGCVQKFNLEFIEMATEFETVFSDVDVIWRSTKNPKILTDFSQTHRNIIGCLSAEGKDRTFRVFALINVTYYLE